MCDLKLCVGALLVAVAVPACGEDVPLPLGLRAHVKGVVALGATLRTGDPDPDNYGRIPSTVVSDAPPGQLLGQTGGSDLNFRRHELVSAVAKGLMDVAVDGGHVGAFLRLAAWHDFVLGHHDVAYGNYPNGFQPGVPLSDRGFAADARFSAVRARDAYVHGRFDLEPQLTAEARLGRQVLSWGTSQLFTGGIGAAVNPADLAAQVRPAALPQEAKVPVGMLSVSLTRDRIWAMEAFMAYEFRPTNVPGCGTFFDAVSVVQPGCNMSAAVGMPIPGTPLATVASLTERALLASGFYLHRDPDVMPRHTGQLGLDARYTVASWATTFHAYLARTHHNLRNTYQVHVEDVNGVTLPAGVAGALARLVNPAGLRYSVVFPEGTRLVGLSFDTAAASATHVLGEFAYRPNQPIGMSPVDLLTASLLRAPTSLLAQRKGYLSVPAGGRFDGYDCFGVMTAVLGATQTQQNVAGAQRIVWSAELGAHRVRGLPDPAVMRYGRGLAFGSAPYLLGGALTPCVETPAGFAGVPGRTCTDDGYVSRSAWGLRGRAAATYAAPTLAALLTPSLLIAKDIHGYAHDGTFSEGRLTARLGLRADWAARWFADLAYVHFGGGRYNLLSDRSHVNMAAGLSF